MANGNILHSMRFLIFFPKEFLLILFQLKKVTGVVKCGGYRYDDGTRYIGDWNHKGQKHGVGHLILAGN